MNTESRLALEILSDSKIKSYQRRYNAVVRFIDTYGVIPSFERIIEGLPKSESIKRNTLVADGLSDAVDEYENILVHNPANQDAISKLDELYDADYRSNR